MPTISIIIVNWNSRDYLIQCLDSIRATTGDLDVETLVVDNASSDGSEEVVLNRFPEVTFINSGGNWGFARGNNIGIEKAQGHYLFLINPDIEVRTGCFQNILHYMDAHPDVGLLGPKIVGKEGERQFSCGRAPSLWSYFCQALWLDRLSYLERFFPGYRFRMSDLEQTRDVEVLNGCFWAVRRKSLDQVGGLDERFFMYSEDDDWSKRFRDAGWRLVYYVGAEAIHYGQGSSSNDSPRFTLEMAKAKQQYVEKHSGKIGAKCFTLIMGLHHLIRYFIWSFLYYFVPAKREQARIKRRFSADGLIYAILRKWPSKTT